MRQHTRVLAATFALGFGLATAASAEMFIYPKDGQSQDQLTKDKTECYSWAVNQTGYDPSRPVVAAATTEGGAQGGEVIGGAARGAALGAIGGAIAGDAGKGAAIGAAVGGGAGVLKRGGRNQQKQASTQASIDQAAAANAKGTADHQRAMSACLESRGYTVR